LKFLGTRPRHEGQKIAEQCGPGQRATKSTLSAGQVEGHLEPLRGPPEWATPRAILRATERATRPGPLVRATLQTLYEGHCLSYCFNWVFCFCMRATMRATFFVGMKGLETYPP